jgi:hypothetical protein
MDSHSDVLSAIPLLADMQLHKDAGTEPRMKPVGGPARNDLPFWHSRLSSICSIAHSWLLALASVLVRVLGLRVLDARSGLAPALARDVLHTIRPPSIFSRITTFCNGFKPIILYRHLNGISICKKQSRRCVSTAVIPVRDLDESDCASSARWCKAILLCFS